jgi:hypothetical protein
LSVAGVVVVLGGSSGCDAAPSCTPSSASRPAVPDRGAAALGPGPGGSCDFAHGRDVAVSSADELRAALNDARPGDRIELADGTYPGHFELTRSGTPTAPIVICGGRGALLDGGALDTGYTLHLVASHVTLSGFTVIHGLKGIMADYASDCLLTGLEVRDIGNEGIHLRRFSSRTVITHSMVHDTGLDGSPHTGEGIYIGSAYENWCEYTDCGPDRSDANVVVENVIGPNTTAESIDIKEGTSFGVVKANVFSGKGMSAPDGADSWMDIKGNGYLITDNHGADAPTDGFQVHAPGPGCGDDNVFRRNAAAVNGPGFGFRVKSGTTGNVIACDNTVTRAASGFANVACQ